MLYTLAIELLEHALHGSLGSAQHLLVHVMFLAGFVAWQFRVVPRFCRLRSASEQEKVDLAFAGSDRAKPDRSE